MYRLLKAYNISSVLFVCFSSKYWRKTQYQHIHIYCYVCDYFPLLICKMLMLFHFQFVFYSLGKSVYLSPCISMFIQWARLLLFLVLVYFIFDFFCSLKLRCYIFLQSHTLSILKYQHFDHQNASFPLPNTFVPIDLFKNKPHIY